ncbi:MAG: helicase-related protein [Pseudomonadota bacterium]
MLDHADRTITAVLGPTNTGKTHYALERMLARPDGIIGLPLRLLAREVYDRLVKLRGPNAVSLITGEEKIAPPRAKYHVATVEAMPLHHPVDFVAIDEVQLCADPDRGHVFTDRLLNARGRYETLFLGSDTIRPRIANLVPKARFTSRERYSTLKWTGARKISRLKPRTAVVAFSVDQVYAIAELIRRQRGGAAVVMGALSPRTRNAQVALYQDGEVDYMVATDAIGMGLNLDVDHVAFAGTSKFDGWRHRDLVPAELAQIAGRAGRFTTDGTFGVTGEASPLDPEIIGHIENHRFKPLSKLMWRNGELNFQSVESLMASLDAAPEDQDLVRAREAEDQATLKTLWADGDVQDATQHPTHVKQLWEVCQVPDFRKVSPTEHASLLGRIYHFLRGKAGCIPSEWLSGQIARLDRTDGDIDALSKRLAFIRTWTYVANRAGWTDEPEHWRETTRAVEDRLSDALHAALTQRFVDRRTSVLMRRLKQKERLVAEIDDNGRVTAEGQFLGKLDGFRFTVDESASGDELKTLKSASMQALQTEMSKRADKLYLSPDSEIDVTDQGGLMWGQDAIGRVEKGDDPLTPKVKVFVDDEAGSDVAEKVERRLRHWLMRRINAQFEPLIQMRDDEAITGLAKGVAFRLAESFGVIRRREIADDIKSLPQDDRALLRKHGVRFGQHFIFMPALLKPAPTRLRLLLWALSEGHEDFAEAPPAGHVTFLAKDGLPDGYYDMAGYSRLNARALRIDMLERLADLLRPMDARGGFEATPDMLSITGCTLEQFADMMGGLGFKAEKGERLKSERPKPPAKEPVEPAEAAEATAGEASTGEGVAGEGATEAGSEGSEEAPAEAAAEASAGAATEAAAGAATEAASEAANARQEADGITEEIGATEAQKAPEPPETAEAGSAEALGTDAPGQAAETEDAAQALSGEPDTADLAGVEPVAAAEAAGDGDGAEPSTVDLANQRADADASESAEGEAQVTEAPTEKPGSDTDAGDGTEAAADENEIFYTFRLAPRGRPNRGPRRDAGGRQDGGRQDGGRQDGQGRRGKFGGTQGGQGAGHGGGKGKAKGKGGGKGFGKGGKPRREDDRGPRKMSAQPPKKDRPIDPDSPFAILQKLKGE